MKKFLSLFVLSVLALGVKAQTWSPDKAHSGVKFDITHMMLTEVTGKFKVFDAKITAEKADLSDAVFDFSADISSIDTDNEMRNGHLQGESWFDAAKYPKMTFKSTSFTKVAGNKYKMTGNLTMKGKTNPVTLDVTMNGPVTDQRSQKQKLGLKATATINRTLWAVGGESEMPVSQELEITASGEFIKD